MRILPAVCVLGSPPLYSCCLSSHMYNIHSLFSVKRPEQQPVFHNGASFVPWGRFTQEVALLSRKLKKRAQQRWLLESEDAGEFLIELLALLYAGKEAVIPPNTQAGTIEQMGLEVEARISLLEREEEEEEEEEESPPRLWAPINPHTARVDLYTSGSTGKPKQVRKTLADFESEVGTFESMWGAELGACSVLATAPHSHMYGLTFRLLWPFCTGRVFDTQTCTSPGLLGERLSLLGPAVVISTPAHLSRLPELLPLEGLAPKLKKIFSSGSPLSLNVSDVFYKALGLRPTEIYGSTETGAIAWREQGTPEGGEAWSPLSGIEVKASPSGALRLSSPHVGGGTPYVLEDAIEMLSGGRFLLKGRMDRVLKVGGNRLSLPEMEGALERHAWIKSAAVLGIVLEKEGRERQTLGAAVTLTPEGRSQLEAGGRLKTIQCLRQHLSRHFEAVLLPRYWRFVECLPTNERGKVAQEPLKALFKNITDAAEDAAEDEMTDKESAPVLFPIVESVCHSEEESQEVRLWLHMPVELEHFAGHFEDMPILPGVIQVDWAVHFAKKHLKWAEAWEEGFSSIEKLKFLAPIFPEFKLELRLKWHSKTCCLEFAYLTPQRTYSTGRLLFDRNKEKTN